MAALMVVAVSLSACSGSDDATDNQTPQPQPQQPDKICKVLKGKVAINGGGTRTVAADGTVTPLTVGEKVYIYYKNTNQTYSEVETAITSVDNNGVADFFVSINDPKDNPENNGEITVVYPASRAIKQQAHVGFTTTGIEDQVGTIDDINSKKLDIAMGSGYMTVGGNDYEATLRDGKLVLQNQLAICKFSLRRPNGGTIYSQVLDHLTISDGTNNYTVTPSGTGINVFYVAMKPVTNADFTFTATANGTYKKENITLADVKTSGSNDYVGYVFDANGDVYSTGNSSSTFTRTYSGVTLTAGNMYNSTINLLHPITPVGMIAYVGNEVVETGSNYKILALSMNECNSSNTVTSEWNSNSTPWCPEHTVACTVEYNTDVTEALKWKDGISMTSYLISHSTDTHNHWAAKAASSYLYDASNPDAPLPAGCSGWFLPSVGQWNLIIKGLVSKKKGAAYDTNISMSNNDDMKYTYLNSITNNADAATLGNLKLWSSSEYNTGSAWAYLPNSGCVYYHNKESYTRVRAVIAY